MKKLINTNQLCDRLQVTRPYILARRKEGMPVIPLGKRDFRYDYDDVIKWLISEKGGRTHENIENCNRA